MKQKSKTDSRRKTSPVTSEGERVKIGRETPPRIVSSAHLVSERSPELSEFEFGMILAVNAFNRWVVRCMTAAGIKDLSALEVLLLHHVHHRARKKKLADICFMYNIEDTHVASYSLKKLIAIGLVESEKIGKEVLFSTTDKGVQVIERYRQVREHCLMNQFSREGGENYDLGEMAQFLRYLSALYDQAARAATSL
jgi:predicted MarR family transcription regulator